MGIKVRPNWPQNTTDPDSQYFYKEPGSAPGATGLAALRQTATGISRPSQETGLAAMKFFATGLIGTTGVQQQQRLDAVTRVLASAGSLLISVPDANDVYRDYVIPLFNP